jgi:hypothetical protein
VKADDDVELGLALAQAPVLFPASVILMSLVQVPSCAVLFPWLRSPAALVAFSGPSASDVAGVRRPRRLVSQGAKTL